MNPGNIVKIRKIEIENIKNVTSGSINCLSNNTFNSDILGIYGQNGSGKTAMLDSIEIIQKLLEGLPLPKHFVDYVSVKTSCSKITVFFNIKTADDLFDVVYTIDLAVKEGKLILKNENLKICNLGKNKNLVSVLCCDIYDNEKLFSPQKT